MYSIRQVKIIVIWLVTQCDEWSIFLKYYDSYN